MSGFVSLPDGEEAEWISESDEPAPKALTPVDDALSAKEAARRLKDGECLLWMGDYHNGRQLLKALPKRLNLRVGQPPTTLLERWRAERRLTSWRAELLGRLVVTLEPDGALPLRRAPDMREAVGWAWGPSAARRVVSLRTLIGASGAAGWRRAGVEVQGLKGRLTPHYGVFSPTRQVYVSLLDALGDVSGQTLLDVGCGTGVLSFVLLQRGLARAVGTDIDSRSVACARENAQNLGFADRFQAKECDLFVPGERFDWVLFNAPWMVGEPATRLDRAVFDAEGQTLARWLDGVQSQLAPAGKAALILSDFPELLGLRRRDALAVAFEAAGLTVENKVSLPAGHGRAKDQSDPLHSARAEEQIRLFVLGAA